VQKLPTGYAENTIQASGAAQALRLVGNVSDQNILEIMTGEMGYPVRLYVDRDGHFWVSDDGHIRGSQLDISNSSIRVYNQDKTQYRELTVAGLSEVQNA
jgi:streptogramin lyase